MSVNPEEAFLCKMLWLETLFQWLDHLVLWKPATKSGNPLPGSALNLSCGPGASCMMEIPACRW